MRSFLGTWQVVVSVCGILSVFGCGSEKLNMSKSTQFFKGAVLLPTPSPSPTPVPGSSACGSVSASTCGSLAGQDAKARFLPDVAPGILWTLYLNATANWCGGVSSSFECLCAQAFVSSTCPLSGNGYFCASTCSTLRNNISLQIPNCY